MTTYRGFGVVQTRNDGVVEDGDAGADRLAGVVEQRGQVRVRSETEAGNTGMSSVDDEEGTVRKRYLSILMSSSNLKVLS